jgi:hypothetical protein
MIDMHDLILVRRRRRDDMAWLGLACMAWKSNGVRYGTWDGHVVKDCM